MVSLQPKHPLYGVVVILTLSVLWRIGLRRILAYAGLENEAYGQTKIAAKRKICADSQGSFVCGDSANNFLQTTTFGGSFLWVAVASFLYGAIVSFKVGARLHNKEILLRDFRSFLTCA
jgi:hypothetical protein